MEKFYITTTLPYVNADPHIGFALEIVQADVIARLHRARGEEVFFNTGTDEHGLKIYRKALEEKQDPQTYVDVYAKKFDALKSALNLSYTNFIRTTDSHHIKAAQEFWKRCDKNGDIYKKNYTVKYCVGCELEKTDSELIDEKCPIHPNQELEFIEEENYFFRFSKYQKPLLDLYVSQPDFVLPAFRLHEIKNFIESGLQDFSVSRLKTKMPWGIPVPGDESQVMYVWFDALVNYISTLGWPEDEDNFNAYWPGIQVAGKDNLRQQSAMWQAMLLSAGLAPSRQIFIHGFITNEGRKISKSLGNMIDPIALTQTYGTDAIRYFLLRGIHAFEDGDWSEVRFKEVYNADLANGLGNLVQRVTTLGASAQLVDVSIATNIFEPEIEHIKKSITEALEKYSFHLAIEALWQLVALGDKYVNETKPWEKSGHEQSVILADLTSLILNIANILEIFLPETAENIAERFGLTLEEIRSGDVKKLNIKKGEPLFARL